MGARTAETFAEALSDLIAQYRDVPLSELLSELELRVYALREEVAGEEGED